MAGKGGQCKHIVAMLFQIIEYKQIDLTDTPDDLTCIQVLQQWHVPGKDECDEAVLYMRILSLLRHHMTRILVVTKNAKHAAQLILKSKIQHHCSLN